MFYTVSGVLIQIKRIYRISKDKDIVVLIITATKSAPLRRLCAAITCQTRFLGATRLSFALAHDVRRLSATLTDILTSVGGSSPNTLSRVFVTDCLQSTNKKKATFSDDFFCLWSSSLDIIRTSLDDDLTAIEEAKNTLPPIY